MLQQHTTNNKLRIRRLAAGLTDLGEADALMDVEAYKQLLAEQG